MQEPLVSILIPVCNAEKTIALAIESCMAQTYGHIEILVLDDGSTDGTVEEIKKFRDVILLSSEKNMGRPHTRNALLKQAKGEFIAWLDADDYMLPDRIRRQVLFMQENPGVDIVGSWILTDEPSIGKRKLPVIDAMIKAHLWFKNCMAQPAILSRNFYEKEQVFYNTDYWFRQDYELWLRLRSKKVFANVPEYLTHYHIGSYQERMQKDDAYRLKQSSDSLWNLKWSEYGFGFDALQKECFRKFLSDAGMHDAEELKKVVKILNAMLDHPRFGKQEENKLMVHLYKLLVLKRLDFGNRLMSPGLWLSLLRYRKLKKMYLIQ